MENLLEKWDISNLDVASIIEKGLENFGIQDDFNNGDFTNIHNSIETAYKTQLFEIINTHVNILKNEEDDADSDDNDDVEKLLRIVHYIYITLLSTWKLKLCTLPNLPKNIVDQNIGLNRFKMFEPTGKAKQDLLLFLYNKLHTIGYRRYKDKCYEPVYNSDQQYTFAWKEKCGIEEFIYKSCRKETNFTQWSNMVNASVDHISMFIAKADDIQFSEIIKDRHIFSFKNGVYITNKDLFIKYEQQDIIKKNIDENTIACKYFDKEMAINENEKDWYTDIETPNLQRILSYQFKQNKESEQICRTMYMFLGRLLYEINELDTWQVMPFLKGIAGTGKSLITKIVKEFYDFQDVGVLSNSSDKQFGLSGFYDKLIFIAPEIRRDFSIDQAAFQSMISGESVVIRGLYKKPFGIDWKVPGIMCGNETPEFTNSSGSLSRRWILFLFLNKVGKQDLDPTLEKKLVNEIPSIIRKCNKAYLQAVDNFGTKNIWAHIPEYFTKNQQVISVQTNPLYNFLNSGKLLYGPQYYCPKDIFMEFFNKHCSDNNLRRGKFTQEAYSGPFSELGSKHNINIKMKRGKKVYPITANTFQSKMFINGLDIRENVEPKTEFNV